MLFGSLQHNWLVDSSQRCYSDGWSPVSRSKQKKFSSLTALQRIELN
jgi:hypothetical protein